MYDELWSEIQDSQGEIFDIPEDFLSEIYETEQQTSDYGIGK